VDDRNKRQSGKMEALMEVSLEITKACVEKTEANQGKVEIKIEACLDEIKVETIETLEDRTRDRTTQTQNKHTQTSMLRVGFEATTPFFEHAKTVHALDRVATVIGAISIYSILFQ
jgi:hypothetical protein